MKLPPLPTNDEIVFAISEPPLGEGQEARVFKVHTNPHFTVRQSLELSNDKVFQYLSESHLVKQPDSAILRRRWPISDTRANSPMRRL